MKKFIFCLYFVSQWLTHPAFSAEKKHKKLPPNLNSKSPAASSPKASEKNEDPFLDRPREEFPERAGKKSTALDSLIPQAAPNCEAKHSLESFLQISSNQKATPVRSGGIYFVSDLREAPQLFFSDGAGRWPEQVTFFPDGLKYFSLSPNEKWLLLAADSGGDEQYDLFLLDASSKSLYPLIVDRTKRIESVSWFPDSTSFAFTSNQRNKVDFDLYSFKISIHDGKVENSSQLLAELKGHNSVSDISDNGQWISIHKFNSVADAKILLYHLPTQKISEITLKPDSYTSEGQFSANSDFLFFTSDFDSGVRQLYRAKISDLNQRKPITFGKWEVDSFQLDRERKFLTLVKNEAGYSALEAHSLDSSGQKVKPLPIPKLDEIQLSHPMYYRLKGEPVLLYSKSSATAPWDIWSFSKGIETRWTKGANSFFKPQCLTREKLVQYDSFDGKKISGFLYQPAESAGPIPFLVSIHGGPEGQSRPAFNKLYQYLLERGFGIFAPNVRGSTGYGREFTLADNYKKRMESVLDALEGAKWLLKKQYSRAGQLGVFGGSYGGFMVLRMLQVEPDLFAAASESVGITNFVTFLKNTKGYRRELREVEYGPLSDEEFLNSISPMNYLGLIKTPLLVFHGANDPRVPVSETEQLVQALKDREVPVEFKIFADEGHGNTKLKNIIEQTKTMAYFFEKKLVLEQNSVKETKK